MQAFHTTVHEKEHYQDLQVVFQRAGEAAAAMDPEKDEEALSWYLLAPSLSASGLDEEIFDELRS